MMERGGGGSPESLVPPGFRFHPTEEELVGYYLRKKVAAQKIDLDVIRDVDLYKIEPWDLQDKCRIGYDEQKEWYFFSHKDKKYPSGTRTNRATVAGFWKATGRDKAVHTGSKLIGMRKTLVFYKGRAPNGQKTDWIMHEYRLESLDDAPPQEEGWVVCRAFKKRLVAGHQMKATGVQSIWDSTFYNRDNEPSSSPIVGSINVDEMICKREIYRNRHNDAHHFVQLPQLEIGPSLPTGKSLRSMATAMEINKCDNNKNNKGENDQSCMGKRMKEVMDWRDLDKFVASQLSHGDGEDGLCVGLGLESHVEEAGTSRMGEISTLDFDNIGICIFNK